MSQIATLSGGTGGYNLLRGLKQYYPNQICAIVAMADSGGSSGRLRSASGILPPGDARQIITALADAESLMAELFKYRFGEKYGELNGHSFGNLFIAAMSDVTGSFEKAILESSKVLRVQGRVLPATIDNTNLYAKLKDGRQLDNEATIDKGFDNEIGDRPPIEKVWLYPPATVYPDTKDALAISNPVVISSGSLYTTIAQILLVNGILEALTDKILIYPMNLVIQPGQTGNFKDAPDYTAADHVALIQSLIGRSLDYVLVNTHYSHDEKIELGYAKEGKTPVKYTHRDRERMYDELGVKKVVEDDFVSSEGLERNLYRHDSDKLGRTIRDIFYKNGL